MTAVPDIDQLKAEIPPGAALDRLTAAAGVAERLRARGDELLDHFVDAARAEGASWSDIGGCLRTSKQAAQQRFAVLADPSPGQLPFGLTGPAADVFTLAAEAGRELGHEYIRPEHLVLGLLAQPDELAGRVLRDLGVSPELARNRVENRLGKRAPRPNGSLGVAPQTKRILAHAGAIAKRLGHKCPRTEHILLAATAPKLHGSAASLLADCGADPEQVCDAVARELSREAPELASRLNNRSLMYRIRVR
jgi:Clp amino terminal domain, pathogenicity island component